MDTYMELIYCQIVDKLGNRLGYSFFSGRCIRRSTIEVFFQLPRLLVAWKRIPCQCKLSSSND